MDEEILAQIPSRTYRLQNGRIAGWIDELAAMRQAIEKVLHTERFTWLIYTDNYGVELKNLLGEELDLVMAEMERIVREALSVDERIIEIENFQVTQESRDTLLVSFFVTTIFGSIQMEQEVGI
ncbi:DUF2634 domain-containing protein [Enterococcus casseliflavus]|uniref:DUF2634 domain-containing protein n=1 Tax=unclassified Enterococcus TaxID=2608891 RepID=UPI0003F7FAC4|nr:DUF2634 domain-containing protein [Enterococcus sp. 8E11_MSG4843]MBO1094953.1 DUF2634 domain-containing protein [Enterococcus casseliflavus]MBO1143397.1 DUF2634 domain-containing protein [Enterococcus casseliflavus]MBV6371341.1 DUF2634 domain-containing protein [Enterococcus casseliflavus]OUZ32517.1 hypothetical protein A5885_002797 [Enterococcus sp. 8E11_MSG4843]